MTTYIEQKVHNHIIQCENVRCSRCISFYYRYFHEPMEYVQRPLKQDYKYRLYRCEFCGKQITFRNRSKHRHSKLCQAFQRGIKLKQKNLSYSNN